jgi:IclR family transcriptional regulator, acetate operon repressor
MPRSANSAVDKALDLVELVASAEHPLRLSELAQAADLHRPTALRVLGDLIRRGWVQRVDDRYLPGPAVLRLPRRQDALAALARPLLERLSLATGMMVNLQVLETDQARVIDVVRPDRLEMISHLLGETLPVHRYAGPQALVAALPLTDRHPYLRVALEDGHPLVLLEQALAEVERTGHALERNRLVASLARAVPDPLCALTLVGPATEFTSARIPALDDALTTAVTALESSLTPAPAARRASA